MRTVLDSVWMYVVHGRYMGPISQPSVKLTRAERRRLKKSRMSSTSSDQLRERKPKPNPMVVIGEFDPMEVLPFTGPGVEPEVYEVNGKNYKIRMTSIRYQTFCKSLKCVNCGIEGVVMRLEHCRRAKLRKPHFNLYAVREDGTYVLMTRDHILPRTLGGTDDIDNQQTMCSPCNHAKGALTPEQFAQRQQQRLAQQCQASSPPVPTGPTPASTAGTSSGPLPSPPGC